MAATTTHQVTITDMATKVVVYNNLVIAPATWTTDRVLTNTEGEYRIARRAMKAALTTTAVRLA